MGNSRCLARCAVVCLVCLLLAGVPTSFAEPEFAAPTVVTDFSDIQSSRRAFGIAAGDFDEDGKLDVVASFVNGNVAFVRGNGDGSFQPRSMFPWKQTFFNGWAFAAADVNDDDHLDVVWGATAPSGPVLDGDVRAFLGNGDGTFAVQSYLVSGVLHNEGVLLGNVGIDAGSLTVGDLDGDESPDIAVGATDGDDTVIQLLFNLGGGVYSMETLFRRSKAVSGAAPIWFAAPGQFGTTLDTIWGLSLSDADGDGDVDLWVGDRVLYVYRYLNDGAGNLSIDYPASPPLPGRPEVYLEHDAYRVFGKTPSLGSGDLNLDGVADVVLGLQQGTQVPSTGVAHDGELIVDVSEAGGHVGLAANPLADVGTKARGVTLADADHDGYLDILVGNYEGQVVLLLQIPPDADSDGIPDNVDNCVDVPNPGQEDLDLDLVGDACDNCVFIFNPGQEDSDDSGVGDACGCPDVPLPHGQGFWHHECMWLPEDQGGIGHPGNGSGNTYLRPNTENPFLDLVYCSDVVLEGLLSFLDPAPSTCEAMDADPSNDQCQKAEKQMTALLLDVCAGNVAESCAIDLEDKGCEAASVGELFFEMATLYENGKCKQIKKCAGALNEGLGFVDDAGAGDGGGGWDVELLDIPSLGGNSQEVTFGRRD